MTRPVAIGCLAVALLVAHPSVPFAADPAVTECGQAYLTLERAFAQRSLRLGRLLCESPDRVDARAAGVVRTTNAEIAAFNARFTASQCDPDIALPVPDKTVNAVRAVLEGQLRSVPLDRFCNGEADPLPRCGNGQADPGELCDGGDLAGQSCQTLRQGSGTLGCSTDCQGFVFADCSGPAYCGNGVTEPERNEACDTGGATVTCDSDCTPPVCGDGFVNAAAGEQCDDGNTITGDACAGCQPTYCGDGVLNAMRGEQCDDGNEDATDDCAGCRLTSCGDGFHNPRRGEQCDDGNQTLTDDCANCQRTFCGDGWVNHAREQCDDGGPTARCDADCTISLCGDGRTNRDAGEECDDGNVGSGDGCSPQCTFECAVAP